MDRPNNLKMNNSYTGEDKQKQLQYENQSVIKPVENRKKSDLQNINDSTPNHSLEDRADGTFTYDYIITTLADGTVKYEAIESASVDGTATFDDYLIPHTNGTPVYEGIMTTCADGTATYEGILRASTDSTTTYLSIKPERDFPNFKPELPRVSCDRSKEVCNAKTRRCRCVFILAVCILVAMAMIGILVYFFGIHSPGKGKCYSPTVENGNSTMEDDTLILHCFTCYKPLNTRVQCENGNWNAAIGCSLVDCGCPSFLSDSESCLLSNTTCGSVATLSCDIPYCYPQYTCSPDGKWISALNSDNCKPHPCGMYDLPPYAILKNEFACVNMTVELKCQIGFQFKSESERHLRCVNETWIQDAECEIPGVISFTPEVPVFDIGSANSLRIAIENSPLWQIIQVSKAESDDTKPTVIVTIFNTSGVVYTQGQIDSERLKVYVSSFRDSMVIELQFEDVKCEDSAMYVCGIIVGNLEKPTAVKSANTTIKVTELSLSQPVLTAPTQAPLGTTITCTCNGSLGLNNDGEKQGQIFLQIKYQNEEVLRNVSITTSQSIKNDCRVYEYIEAEIYVTNETNNATLRCMTITALDEPPLYSDSKIFKVYTGLDIRLWPVNEKGNEGFVEVFYNGSWGFIGNPQDRFDHVTASSLCQILGLSQFGYSSGWTSIDNYMGYSWLSGLMCSGGETDIVQCFKPYDWNRYDYGSKTEWAYRHGTRLFCTDSRLVNGEYQNRGRVETVIQGEVYAICLEEFDINAANVFCSSLGYDGANEVYKGDSGQTTMFPGSVTCKGCEDFLNNCTLTSTTTNSCTNAAHVTCKAVRMARMSSFLDEGPVEIFYNGSWGLIGDPGFHFDDTTARYFCKIFGFGDIGFSTTAHSLLTYGRKGWLSSMTCTGNETDAMQCARSSFSTVPSLINTYRRGTWLYCFDFRVDDVRLIGGADKSEGTVQLQINGRWGYICTYAMRNLYMENAGKVLCKQMGYSTFGTVLYEDNIGHSDDLVWMSEVACDGDETSIGACYFTKGPITPCFDTPVYLRIKCTDQDQSEAIGGSEIRLWPVNERGNEGFVEVFYNGSWGFIGNPQDRFDDVTASFLCKNLGLSRFGYSSGWTSVDNFMGYTWLSGLVCSGNETDIDQCIKSHDWYRYNYGNSTGYYYRYGTRLYCTDSRLFNGEYQNSGRVETAMLDKIYSICYDAFDMNAANVFCSNLGYNGAIEVYKGDSGQTSILPGILSCKGCEDSLSNCTFTEMSISTCKNAAHVTCKAVRLARMSRYIDEGPVEIYYNRSWGLIGSPGFQFDDTTARFLCKTIGFGDVGFSTTAHSLTAYGRKAWLSSMSCTGTETNIMNCTNSGFSTVPSLMNTYKRGTWLYCFDFRVDDVRLVGGSNKSEGTVQLLINGRWGYICTFAVYYLNHETVGKVLCKQMGYRNLKTVLYQNSQGQGDDDLVWMWYVTCGGDETSIDACSFTKGPVSPCLTSKAYLSIQCTDQDPSDASTTAG